MNWSWWRIHMHKHCVTVTKYLHPVVSPYPVPVCLVSSGAHWEVTRWRRWPMWTHTCGKNLLHTACASRRGPTGDTATGWRKTAQDCSAADTWRGSSIEGPGDLHSSWEYHGLHIWFSHLQGFRFSDVAVVAQVARISSEI